MVGRKGSLRDKTEPNCYHGGEEGTVMSDIAKNIKRLRQKKGLTQEELAEKLFVTRQAVSNWETGKNQPDIELLKSLAETFEVDVTEMLYAPKPDEEKGKRIIVAAVFCTLTVIAWAGYIPFEKWTIAWKSNRFDLIPALICIWALKPLACTITGVAAAALFRVWVDTLPKAKLRRGMWIVGAAVCLFYIAFLLWYFFGYQIGLPMPVRVGVFLMNYLYFPGPWVFFIPGALFFLAWPRKAG